jgi:hypothetical protein
MRTNRRPYLKLHDAGISLYCREFFRRAPRELEPSTYGLKVAVRLCSMASDPLFYGLFSITDAQDQHLSTAVRVTFDVTQTQNSSKP